MKKNGLKNRSINNPTEPMELSNCYNILINNPNIIGGPNNIKLLNCTKVVINGGTLQNPEGPNDPEGKHILMDKCEDITLNGITCTCVKPSGDGFNFYMTHNGRAIKCKIYGPKDDGDDKAASICIDDGSSDIKLDGLDLRNFGKVAISIAFGYNIEVCNTKILTALSSGIQIDGDCYKTIIHDINIHNNTIKVNDCQPVWWNPKWTKKLTIDGKKYLFSNK